MGQKSFYFQVNDDNNIKNDDLIFYKMDIENPQIFQRYVVLDGPLFNFNEHCIFRKVYLIISKRERKKEKERKREKKRERDRDRKRERDIVVNRGHN